MVPGKDNNRDWKKRQKERGADRGMREQKNYEQVEKKLKWK